MGYIYNCGKCFQNHPMANRESYTFKKIIFAHMLWGKPREGRSICFSCFYKRTDRVWRDP